jgi:hypothetical protein
MPEGFCYAHGTLFWDEGTMKHLKGFLMRHPAFV